MDPHNPYSAGSAAGATVAAGGERILLRAEGWRGHQFVRAGVPRLSVDIDLVYLPGDERAVALQRVAEALDRQHPRDFFDVMLLMDSEGLTENLRKAILIYLVSHPRPMEELLAPNFKPLAEIYAAEFQGMTLTDVPLAQLEAVRARLVAAISSSLSDADKAFLCAIYEGEPDASALGLATVMELPAVKWRLRNVARMPKAKRLAAAARLRSVLGV